MNELQMMILSTIKAECSSPVVTESSDARLRDHVAELAILANYLEVELLKVPGLKQAAMRELLAIARRADGANGAVAQKLAQLCSTEDATQFDACLNAARELHRHLVGVGTPEAMQQQKQLALAEGRYARQVLDVNAQMLHPKDATAGAAAGQMRAYDEGKLSRFLATTFPQEKDMRLVESNFIAGGSSKYTMLMRVAGAKNVPEEMVLRGDSVSSAGYGGMSAVDEHRLLTVMHAHGACVPKPVAVETSGDVFGSPFMLTERRPGVMIGHMFKLPPPNQTTARDIAKQLAKIHLVPLDAIGDWMRGCMVKTSEQVAATIEQSAANWQALNRPSPMFDATFKYLRDNVAVMDRSRGLVHGDYGLNNILIHEDKVGAVLDWEFAHIGNSAYDLGYFYYQAEALASWQEFLDAYAAAGAPLPSKEELDFSILFAVVRLGVMVCQAEMAFRAGIAKGLFISLTFGRNSHNTTLQRLHDLLERIL